MREKFATNGTAFILRYYNYEGKGLDKIKYGLLTFYSFFTKTITVFVIALLLGTFWEMLVFKTFYMITRCFSYGAHATKNIYCWIITLSIYTFVPILISLVTINDITKFWIVIIALISFVLYAPSDTHKRPLINKKKRHFSKMMSLIILIFFEIIILFTNNKLFINCAALALIIQCICLYPLTYRIFKMPYNNYMTYKRGLN